MNRDLTRNQRIVKYIVYIAVIAVAALLQNVSGLFWNIGNAHCLFLIPVAVIFACGDDEGISAIIGLIAGIFWDFDSAAHMGFNALYLMIICFFISSFVINVTRNTFVTNLIFTAAAVVLYCILYWLFFIVIKGIDGGGVTLVTFYLPTALYTIILSPVIYLIINPIKRKVCRLK